MINNKVAPSVDMKSVKAALAFLIKKADEKMSKEAVKKEHIKPMVEGATNVKTPDFSNEAVEEVEKIEHPKGYVKAGLMGKNWSVNEKELEKDPKQSSAQAISPNMAVAHEEVKKEQVKLNPDSKGSLSSVKKYFQGFSEAPSSELTVSMDKKSSKEVEMLKTALLKAEAEKKALLEEKEKRIVADKIYDVVSLLKEKELIAEEDEDAVVDILAENFDAKKISAVSSLVKLFKKAEKKEEEVKGTIPQFNIDDETPEVDTEGLDKIASILRNNW